MKMVNVTRVDIQKGKKGSARSCPIAIAMRKMGFSQVEVFGDQIWAREKGEATTDKDGYIPRGGMPAPRSVERFVYAFDEGLPVKPFRFKLDLQ